MLGEGLGCVEHLSIIPNEIIARRLEVFESLEWNVSLRTPADEIFRAVHVLRL
jgi:hypothetical protein